VIKQLDTSIIVAILNITFVLVERDNYVVPPISGHLYSPKNDIK